MYDPTGHMPEFIENAIYKFLDRAQPFINGLIEDIYYFNPNNQSEAVVQKSNYFSCYKGKPVIRTDDDRSGSFGVLFISRKYDNKPEDFAEFQDDVRHEYGHTKQLDKLGAVGYLLCIGFPSRWEWGSDKEYYRRPWEITADIFGGVRSRTYPGYTQAGYDYLSNSDKWGVFVWLTIE